MRCLVTGGAGFIGRWLVKRLLADGHAVQALDNLSNGRKEHLADFHREPRFLGLTIGDLRDRPTIDNLFNGEPWDIVFHLGSSVNVQRSLDDPWETFANDVCGTMNILEVCRKQYFELNGLDTARRSFETASALTQLRDRRPRVVVMSTSMCYSPATDESVTEHHPLNSTSPYVACKVSADALALSYHSSYNLPVTVARAFNTYGPFQKPGANGGVVSTFLHRDITGHSLTIKGSGAQTRDFLFVDDCVDFLVRASVSPAAEGRILNAGTGVETSVMALAHLCALRGGVETADHDHPHAEVMRLVCDASLARDLLGWEPRISLSEGIARTRAWLDKQP